MNVMAYRMHKNNWNYKKHVPMSAELYKLSFEQLNAIFQMSAKIVEGNYHKDYIAFYKSVLELLRMELDERIQNKLFKTVEWT